MTEDEIAESDRAPGAPHPRKTATLVGQDAAEAAFIDAWTGGRMHHAWLISGARGIGKATLAWRIARFLLATQKETDTGLFGDAPAAPTTLDIDPDHLVAKRMLANSEPRLFLLRRAYEEKTNKFAADIRVDDARRLKSFFSLSAADGGHRVVIVDAADEMNTSAANALLKVLEEPPAQTTLLLISHQPSRLLPTIRSRCRTLRCMPLSPDHITTALAAAGVESPENPMAIAQLASGSVGEALRLITLDGLATYAQLVKLLSRAPGIDRPAAIALAERVSGRGKEDVYAQFLDLFDLFLTRAARLGATGNAPPEAAPGEAALLARLSPTPQAACIWAELQQFLGARARHGKAVNLDPSALILDMVLRIDETARKLVSV